MSCPRHPLAPFGTAGSALDGRCWECEGRPPDWICSVCAKRYPCKHNEAIPASSKEEADQRARVLRAVESYHNGAAGLENLERCLDLYARAVRDGYKDACEKARRN